MGTFSIRVTPSSTTEYRLQRARGRRLSGPATVNAVVSVRRPCSTQLVVRPLHGGRVGTRVSIVAPVNPRAAGVAIAFRLERWSPVSRTWRLVGTLNRHTDAAGRASVILGAVRQRALSLARHRRVGPGLLHRVQLLGALVDRALTDCVVGPTSAISVGLSGTRQPP